MTIIATASSTLIENMRQLWRRNSCLAQQIDELPLNAGLALQASRSGAPTATVTTTDGRTLFLHSRYDPENEATEFANSLPFDDSACIVLCGLGLGYVAKAILKRFGEETCLFVGEPDSATLKSALETTDFSAEIASGRIEFLTRFDTAHLHERLRGHWARLMLGTRIVVPPISQQHHSEFFAGYRSAMTDFAGFARMSLMTLMKNAGITCRNIANNLPTYVSTPSLEILHRRFSGYPAILVAAGPSLSKNVDQLRELQDRAVIIAAQTTLRPLLERGIRPHFVTSLDYSELSRQFFDNIEIPPEVVLVAEPKASWHVVDAFQSDRSARERRVILLDSPFAHRCIGRDLGRRAGLEAGATVMHLAFYLAEWLGCDPIIFIGQDLGFTNHCYYAPGVAVHHAWEPELGRFCTLEMKEWERIARHGNILRKTTDIHGRALFTDEQMFTYLQQFERDFARSPARVIDATEGGARKAGAAPMSLQDAAARHCSRPIDPACFDYLKTPWSNPERLPLARSAMAARLEEVQEIRSICTETRSLLERLRAALDRPAEFNRLLVRVDEMRMAIQKQDTAYQMIRDASQLAEFQRMAADRRIDEHSSDQRNRAAKQLDRDDRFVDALIEGCDRVDAILRESLERFSASIARFDAMTTGTESSAFSGNGDSMAGLETDG